MPAKILKATKHSHGYTLQVHLDAERVDEAGQPHPDWVREWTWGLPQPNPEDVPLHENGGHHENGAFHQAVHTQHGADLTEAAYLHNIREMLPGMIVQEIAFLRAEEAHPVHRDPQILESFHGSEIQ